MTQDQRHHKDKQKEQNNIYTDTRSYLHIDQPTSLQKVTHDSDAPFSI